MTASMVNYAVVLDGGPENGRVVRTGRCPSGSVDAQAGAGEVAKIGVFDDETQYDNGGPTSRPAPTASIDKATLTADGVDFVTLSNVASVSDVMVVTGEATLTLNGGVIEIRSTTPGRPIHLVVPQFPTQDFHAYIHAN